jgi:predicted PurR-regulated permease PerM
VPEHDALRTWFLRTWTLVGVALLAGGAWWLLRAPLAVVLPPLALAAVVVYLLNPFVGALERRQVPRLLGTALAYVVAAGVLIIVGALLGPVLARQTVAFGEELPRIAESVQNAVNSQLRRIGLPALLSFELDDATTAQAITDWLAQNRDQVLSLLRGAGSVVNRLVHVFLTLVLAPILAFYALADLPRIRDGIERLVPPGRRTELVDVAQRISGIVGAYFRGQLLVAAFVGVATSIGLAIIGLPFWSLVGLLAGLFNLVPLIGPFVGGVLGVTVALTAGTGTQQAVLVIVVMVAVQQVDNHVITPNIIARTVKVHPITVILALLFAASTFGLLGMFVAIPAIAAIKLVGMYVLVTRFPSLGHLAGDGPGLFGEDPSSDPPEGTLVALGRELRSTWERRRSGENPHE